MIVTIPNLGNISIAAKALFDGLKIPYIMPEVNHNDTLKIGSFYSPEEICLPFKIMMGNYIRSIEKGADTILFAGSCGPCRFGEYCELQMKLLTKFKPDLRFIVIDSPLDIGKKAFLKRLNEINLSSSASRKEKLSAMLAAYHTIRILDQIDAKAHELAGYEREKGACKNLLYSCKREASACDNPVQMLKVLNDYKKKLRQIPLDYSKNPLKVAIIGEIYTIIEPFSNLYIEEKLMDYSVSSKRTLTPSWWLKDTFLKPLKINSLAINHAAKKYLPYKIGGHGRECVGESLLAQQSQMDGAIQIMPLACMPEVVAKSILPSIQREKDFPIMTLVIDEMVGEAGYLTRIEAFLDMLEYKRKTGVKWAVCSSFPS